MYKNVLLTHFSYNHFPLESTPPLYKTSSAYLVVSRSLKPLRKPATVIAILSAGRVLLETYQRNHAADLHRSLACFPSSVLRPYEKHECYQGN